MGALSGWGKAYLKSKAKGITSVKPGTDLGGKTVKEWKSKVQHKKYLDAIRDAGHEITGNLKKSAKKLEDLTKTLKKQKKILDD